MASSAYAEDTLKIPQEITDGRKLRRDVIEPQSNFTKLRTQFIVEIAAPILLVAFYGNNYKCREDNSGALAIFDFQHGRILRLLPRIEIEGSNNRIMHICAYLTLIRLAEREGKVWVVSVVY